MTKNSIRVNSFFQILGVVCMLVLSCTVSVQAQVYTFTNANATGRLGPTQTQVNTAYTATSLDGQVTSSNGIQIWTVPATGLYRIEAYGAQGGGANGGLGAYMSGEFQLTQSDIIHVLVGQEGLTQAGEPFSVGGGGGSFVVRAPATAVANILVIAGGGGGSPGTHSPLRDAVTTGNGNAGAGTTQSGTGGTGGNGGNATQRGAGGAGFLTNGQSSTQTAASAEGGYSFLNGGNGGNHNSTGVAGSFGGGGASWQTGFRGAGGGGGYSGGGGAQVNTVVNTLSGGGGGSYNTGTNQTNTAGVRQGNGMVVFTMLIPAVVVPNDAGITALPSLSAGFCAGNQAVTARIVNFGNEQIDSVYVNWEVNSTSQPGQWFTFSPPIDTVGTINNFRIVNLGNYNFPSGTHTVKAWTSLPNNMPDTVNGNDTFTFTGATKMGGTYTINSAVATGGTNYQTFAAFINDLNTYGVCGPVIANVNPASGPYNELLYFGDIDGASAINTIRINGNGRTVQYNCDINNRQLIRLIGTKYLTIDSLNFISQNATYGWAAAINNGAAYDSITRCNFNMTATTNTTAANTSGICFTGDLANAITAGADATNCYIGGNTIQGPAGSGGYYYAVTLTSGADSNVIENNNFYNYYFYGAYLNASRHNIIRGNEFARPTKTAVTTFYGVYTTGATEGTQIIGNRIYRPGGTVTNATNTGHGIYMLGTGTAADPRIVANNVVYYMNTGGTSYGMYFSSATYTKVLHNTVVYDQIQTGTTAQSGIWVLGTNTGMEIINNIVSFTGGNTGIKYGMVFTTAAALTSVAELQRNNIYVNSTQTGAQWHSASPTATTYATLAAFQTAHPTREIGSLSVDPQFTNAAVGNFLPTNSLLQGNGLNLSGLVPTDIINILRGTLPTPGAWEIPSNPGPDAGVQALITPGSLFCSNQQSVQVSIMNSGTLPLSNFQVHWTFNGNPQTPFTYTGTLPIFGQGQHIDTITLGNINIPAGTNTIKAWTTVANDVNNLNDTLLTTVSPSTFTVSTPSDTLCIGGDATISLTPNTGYTTGMIQWQISSNGTTFTNIPNSDQPSWTETSLTANRWFRAMINSGMGGCYSDTASIFIIDPQILSTTPNYTCGPGTVQLGATSSAGTIIEWYDVATGGTAIDTGVSFTTPFLTNTTTYYAAAKSGGGSGNIPELMYYKFDVPGNTVLNEASSPVGNNPASVVGLTIGGNGQFGMGLQGNAGATATNRVDPGWTGTHTGSWTISFWMDVPTPPTTRYMFGNSTGGGTFRCFIGGAANGIRLTGGIPSITLDMPAWTPGVSVVTYVYDQSTGIVSGYINGVFQASATPGTSYPITGTNFVVGSQGTSIDGIMDEFRMYSRALSAAEVAGTWNSQLGGCEGVRVPVLASVLTPPTPVDLGTDTGMCLGHTITLDAGVYPSGYTYLWDNSSTNQTRVVNATGNYHVTVTSTNGCTTSDTVFVNAASDFSVDLGNDTTICDGNVLVLDAGHPNYTYLWDDNSTNQTRSITTSGTYYVEVVNSFGCEAYDTIEVTVNPTPIVDLGPDTTTCKVNPIMLDAGNPGSDYLWNDNSTGQTLLAVNHGTYYVTVTNTFDCSATDSIVIFPELEPTGDFDMNEWPGLASGSYTFVAKNLMNTVNYHWDFGDGSPTQTGNPVNYTYSSTGVYTAKLYLYNECNTEVIISKTRTVLVGLDDIVNENDILFYPNPASDKLTIENKGQQKIESLIIYDALGRVVKQIDDMEGLSKMTILLDSWSDGIYSVVINTGNNTYSKRITISKK